MINEHTSRRGATRLGAYGQGGGRKMKPDARVGLLRPGPGRGPNGAFGEQLARALARCKLGSPPPACWLPSLLGRRSVPRPWRARLHLGPHVARGPPSLSQNERQRRGRPATPMECSLWPGPLVSCDRQTSGSPFEASARQHCARPPSGRRTGMAAGGSSLVLQLQRN